MTTMENMALKQKSESGISVLFRFLALAGGYNYDSTAVRRLFVLATSIRRPIRLNIGLPVVGCCTKEVSITAASGIRRCDDWGTIRSASLISVVSRCGHCLSLLYDR